MCHYFRLKNASKNDSKAVDLDEFKRVVSLILDMFFTSNHMSIHLEIGDKRFFYLKVSQKHKKYINYFTKLSNIFTQETENHFSLIVSSINQNKIVELFQ